MLRFLRYIALVFVLTVAILAVLDWGATSIQGKAKHRTVFQRLINGSPKRFDFVVVGSSRVACHLDPKQIEEQTGLVGTNLTRLGCGSDEALLMTRLFFENGHRTPRLYIQVDHSWEEQTPQPLPMAAALPFLRDEVVSDHYKDWPKFPAFYHIPYYRYALFSPEVGFRETVMTTLKDTKSRNPGFSPIDGEFRGGEIFEVTLTSPRNPPIEEIIRICDAHGCTPHFFTAPFYSFEGADFDRFLGSKLPNYHDFSRALTEKKYFRDKSHLNLRGARKFTELFADPLVC